MIKHINQWEKDSIDKIKQTAEQCRQKLTNKSLLKTEKKSNHLTQKIKEMRQENELDDVDLNYLTQRLQQLQEEFL